MLLKRLPGLLLVAAFTVAEADTLLIDGLQMAESTRAERPTRGETKARVEQQFGAPTAMIAAVGDPPISRWEYPSFVVYFEGDLVIHAVRRH